MASSGLVDPLGVKGEGTEGHRWVLNTDTVLQGETNGIRHSSDNLPTPFPLGSGHHLAMRKPGSTFNVGKEKRHQENLRKQSAGCRGRGLLHGGMSRLCTVRELHGLRL